MENTTIVDPNETAEQTAASLAQAAQASNEPEEKPRKKRPHLFEVFPPARDQISNPDEKIPAKWKLKIGSPVPSNYDKAEHKLSALNFEDPTDFIALRCDAKRAELNSELEKLQEMEKGIAKMRSITDPAIRAKVLELHRLQQGMRKKENQRAELLSKLSNAGYSLSDL